MNPYRLFITVTLIRASPPAFSRALSAAWANVPFPHGITPKRKKRQLSSLTWPICLYDCASLKIAVGLAVLFVTRSMFFVCCVFVFFCNHLLHLSLLFFCNLLEWFWFFQASEAPGRVQVNCMKAVETICYNLFQKTAPIFDLVRLLSVHEQLNLREALAWQCHHEYWLLKTTSAWLV